MADISKIKVAGVSYDIKDAVAREAISGAIIILGATTTALADEATTNPITVNGESVTAVANDAVFYNSKEFVFDGTYWHEFGDMSGLKDMAWHDLSDVEYETTATGTSNVTAAVSTEAVTEQAPATYTPEVTISTNAALGYGSGNSWDAIKLSVGTGNDAETLIVAAASEPTIATQAAYTGTSVRLVTGNIAVPSTFSTTSNYES